MKQSNKRIVRRCLLLAGLLLLLGSGVYAWIYGNVTPELWGEFRIGSMAGLNFKIDTQQTDLVDLNSYLGISSECLNLNELSSVDGESFVARDTSRFFLENGNPLGNREVITFRDAEENIVVQTQVEGETVSTVTGDYMDISFQMLLDYSDPEPADYYIYYLTGDLDNTHYLTGFAAGAGASITENGLRALRACLRVDGASDCGPLFQTTTDLEGQYTLFANADELGTEAAPFHTAAVAADETVPLKKTAEGTPENCRIGGSYYIDYLSGIDSWPHSFGTLVNDLPIHSFASCSIDPSELGNLLSGSTLPNENYLFRMDNANKSVTLTLRVWLEGGSDFCQNSSIGSDDEIGFHLYFIAYKIPRT